MIGNDVVDLHLAQSQSNWERKGFLEKIFTKNEQRLIHTSNQSHQLVWRLWTMKESVYKVVVQQEKERFFNPQKFECHIESDSFGHVVFNGEIYKTFTEQNEDYIYSTTSKANQTCFYQLGSMENRINTMSKRLGLQKSEISVRKDSLGIPNVYHSGQRITKSMSITNHGRFEALQFEIL
ncbi:MAG: hypothetical protein CMB99_09815 [Flavobacteriaceae bacterium]|nr:hypothetical protein [Flavobacteriaceae bacterium]|tara:strand:+ start:371420 stop:371959 length:540 start_codon:yes stop_codon:yes gene_type:complete